MGVELDMVSDLIECCFKVEHVPVHAPTSQWKGKCSTRRQTGAKPDSGKTGCFLSPPVLCRNLVGLSPLLTAYAARSSTPHRPS